jgi:hypothetical protein
VCLLLYLACQALLALLASDQGRCDQEDIHPQQLGHG